MPRQRKLLPCICQPYTDFLHISSSVPGGSGCGGKPSSIGLSYPGMEGCGQGGSDLPHGGRAAQSPGALCGGAGGGVSWVPGEEGAHPGQALGSFHTTRQEMLPRDLGMPP